MTHVIYLLVGFVVGTVTFAIGARMARRSLEAETNRIRAEHVAALERERRSMAIVRRDLELDSEALALSCMDHLGARHATIDGPLYPGVPDWKALRAIMREVARRRRETVRIPIEQVA